MRDKRLLIGVAVIVALIALFLVFRPGNDGEAETGTTTTSPTETAPPTLEPTPTDNVELVVTVRGGKPVDGIVRAEAKKGDPVVVIVRSDVADEVHVHGYDLMADVAPGSPARISFEASVPGRFEVEFESRAIQIAELRVGP